MADANDSTTPGKVTTDGKKFTYSTELGGLGMSELGKQLFPGAAGNAGSGGTTGLSKVGINPFSLGQSGEFSPGDLAGLTPEMISQAMQFKLGTDQFNRQFEQQKINDLINNIHKMGMLEAQQPKPAQIFVKDVPGYGNLTLDQYKALPTEDREYITHVLSARQRGEEPMSRKDFDAIGDKDKHPASAEAAAIDQLYREYKGAPPQPEIKKIHDLYNPPKTPEPKTPSPVTWTTATNELTKRFGKLDPTGMWAVTSELQASHRLAQKILVQLKDQGYDPLRSVNMAEEYANKYYNTLNAISDEAKKIKDEATRRRYILEQTKTINEIFKSQLEFNPGE
jgi:hypothetical protein